MNLYDFFWAVSKKIEPYGLNLFMQPTEKNTWLFVAQKDGLYSADHVTKRLIYEDEDLEMVSKAMINAFTRAEKRKKKNVPNV